MPAALLTTKTTDQRSWLYPLLVVAAISVIIFSVLGAAAIAGWFPRSETSTVKAAGVDTAAAANPRERATGRINERLATEQMSPRIANTQTAGCAECGVVASIEKIETKAKTHGLGTAAGGVTGALVGNQVGRANDNAVATVGGAAGGAFSGNELEKQLKKDAHYKMRVRLEDGTYRTTYSSTPPAYAIGDKVKVSNGRMMKSG